jgi:hypothetical protein
VRDQLGSKPAPASNTIARVDPSELRRRVDALADEPDRLRRRLIALGALTARLAPLRIEPILVGGLALEIYTDGGYGTGEVDLALPRTPDVDRAFADLGFAEGDDLLRRLPRAGEAPQGRVLGRNPLVRAAG